MNDDMTIMILPFNKFILALS